MQPAQKRSTVCGIFSANEACGRQRAIWSAQTISPPSCPIPFYYGHFSYAGEVHEGNHEPIISKKLFDAVTPSLNAVGAIRLWIIKTNPKRFSDCFIAPNVAGAITGEIQKGHTYYRCTKENKTGRCTQPYIREEDLNIVISDLLKPYSLRADWADEMLTRVNEEKKQSDPDRPSLWPDKSAGRLKRSISASKNFSTHFSTVSLSGAITPPRKRN